MPNPDKPSKKLTNTSEAASISARPARLALADGSVFRGVAFGATTGERCVTAEVVFNTAMTGYQESLTDPSYAGQILTLTTAQVGNTGINPEDMESDRVHPRAMIVRELARTHSNYRANESLSSFLKRHGTLGIAEVDTRALTRRLRSVGVMAGAASDDASMSDAELIEQARRTPSMTGQNLVSEVAGAQGDWDEGLGEWGPDDEQTADGARPVVLAIDCGAKSNILRHLSQRGCEVVRIAPDVESTSLIERLNLGEAQGLFISNGPGDPAAVERTVSTLREVIDGVGAEVPIFGICLGHQLIAQAVGGKTYKLPFGHRGANQPVFSSERGRVEITSQNHGFAVDPSSLDDAKVRVTHTHLNDGTVAGLEVLGRCVFSVQHHPEASPGPHDASYLFVRFVDACRQRMT